MAIEYSLKQDGVLYEIRTAGRSVRLYTDNVLHTQYHPERRVTGGVWDLLALPALALSSVKRVLVLGVGGGAALHLLRDWCPGVHITGIELNPVHLELAQRFFGLEGSDLTLVQADARAYVEQYRGKLFDMVIEDLFGGNNGEPDRTFDADTRWCKSLGLLVNNRGALVINTLGRKQLFETALVKTPSISQQWAAHLCLTVQAYENHVGAFFRNPVSPTLLRTAIRSDDKRLQQEGAGQLRYKIRNLLPLMN